MSVKRESKKAASAPKSAAPAASAAAAASAAPAAPASKPKRTRAVKAAPAPAPAPAPVPLPVYAASATALDLDDLDLPTQPAPAEAKVDYGALDALDVFDGGDALVADVRGRGRPKTSPLVEATRRYLKQQSLEPRSVKTVADCYEAVRKTSRSVAMLAKFYKPNMLLPFKFEGHSYVHTLLNYITVEHPSGAVDSYLIEGGKLYKKVADSL